MSILFFSHARAQDKIVKKNGETIEVKVIQITSRIITYKRLNNLEGPEYSIPKMQVSKVIYANGSEDNFDRNNERGRDGERNGNKYRGKNDSKTIIKYNIIAIAPLQFNQDGPGVGLSYERILDKEGYLSFNLPAFYLMNSSSGTNSDNNNMVYLMPGAKYYPNIKSDRKFKVSLGIALMVGVGTGRNYSYSSSYNGIQNRFLMGPIANFGGNVFPTAHLYMGFEIGIGLPYLNEYNGINVTNSEPMIQGSFKVGYRF